MVMPFEQFNFSGIMKITILLGIVLFLMAVDGKIVEKCRLAKVLKNNGMDGYKTISLPNWICLAEWGSNYNTRARHQNSTDGSTNYGIFQINSRYWCADKKTPGAVNGCNMTCREMMKNVHNSIKCVKKIVHGPQDMLSWVTWKEHCQGKDLSKYVKDCRL